MIWGFFNNYGLARACPRLPQLTANSDSRQCSSIVRDCELLLKAQGGIRNQNYAFSEPVYEACRPHRKISTDTDQMCPVRLHYGWSERAHRHVRKGTPRRMQGFCPPEFVAGHKKRSCLKPIGMLLPVSFRSLTIPECECDSLMRSRSLKPT